MSTSTAPDVEKELQEIAAGGRASSADYSSSSTDYTLDPTSLHVTDEAMKQGRWAEALREICPEARNPWHVGDLLAFGERKYGDGTYQFAADSLGYESVGSLRNLAYLSRHVPPEVRQPTLSWRAHRVVSRLSTPDQKRWLRRAVENGWTSVDLGRELAACFSSVDDGVKDGEKPETDEAAVDLPSGENVGIDHSAHWESAGMPGYEPQPEPFKVVVNCDTEADLEDFMDEIDWPTVHNKSGRTISVHWPDRPLDDVRNVEFREAVAS